MRFCGIIDGTQVSEILSRSLMSGPNFQGDRSRMLLSVIAVLLMLAGIAWWRYEAPGTPVAALSESTVVKTGPSFAVPLRDAPEPAEIATLTWKAPLPSADPPGHEGHGDVCAECLAERKLAVYREDYAQLQFAQALQGRVLPAELSGELQDACRRFSRAVLREWSFTDSKPRLPDDATVENLRSEMLHPLIERLPPAVAEAP
jgi:hypothetical protein